MRPAAAKNPSMAPMAILRVTLGDEGDEGRLASSIVLTASASMISVILMLTDSRSFLSYPRHEYFRRILCNLIGEDIEAGKLPRSEMDFLKQMVADISYYNAKRYFNF